MPLSDDDIDLTYFTSMSYLAAQSQLDAANTILTSNGSSKIEPANIIQKLATLKSPKVKINVQSLAGKKKGASKSHRLMMQQRDDALIKPAVLASSKGGCVANNDF